MSSRAVAANKRRAKGKPKGTAAASTQDPSISGRPSTSMGMSMSAAEEELHVSGSFWELYDNVADDEVTQAGTSRHGFLAGEQSWSMRSSTTAQPARGGGRGRKTPVVHRRHVVMNQCLSREAASTAGSYY